MLPSTSGRWFDCSRHALIDWTRFCRGRRSVRYQSFIFRSWPRSNSCWFELGSDPHRILGYWNDARWAFLAKGVLEIFLESVSLVALGHMTIPFRWKLSTGFNGQGNMACAFSWISTLFLEVRMAGWVYRGFFVLGDLLLNVVLRIIQERVSHSEAHITTLLNCFSLLVRWRSQFVSTLLFYVTSRGLTIHIRPCCIFDMYR